MEVIPANAVLQSPAGPYVLVFARDRGTASKRSIEIGRTTTGLAAVTSGLGLREMVVSVNAFFWDAERRLHADARAGGGGAP
jgi:multidrug efflux pump subunit AcrA (membrane-fusion protein)